MGSIADKLTYLQETKTAIKNAIVTKGVTINDTDTFRSYADKISSISSGSAGTPLVIDSLPAFIVGSPNNDSGIVSGFEDNNYVDDKQYDTLVGKSYYIKFRFTGNSIPNQSCIIHGEKLLNLEVSTSGQMTAYNFKAGRNITLLNSIEFNTWYYAIITMEEIAGQYSSTNKKYYISTISYNHAKANGLKETFVDDSYHGNARSTFFGRSSYAAGSAATTLVIDFNDTCIKYNDSDTIYKVYKLDTTVIGEVKESTFTGYIAQSGSTNILPTILQPVYGNEFKGLMKINNLASDRRKFILDSTFNSGTDGTLEAFIHYIHDPNSTNSGIFSIGGVHWKAVYVGIDASLSRPFIDIGNNGSSWAFEPKLQNVNLIEHPEIYFKLIINTSSVNIIAYDADKTTILDEKTFEIDTTPIDSTIILFNNWDLYDQGGAYGNTGTIDLSDSYIKINDVVVQGILK